MGTGRYHWHCADVLEQLVNGWWVWIRRDTTAVVYGRHGNATVFGCLDLHAGAICQNLARGVSAHKTTAIVGQWPVRRKCLGLEVHTGRSNLNSYLLYNRVSGIALRKRVVRHNKWRFAFMGQILKRSIPKTNTFQQNPVEKLYSTT